MGVGKKSINGLGIASLVFGIVGILTICGCGIGFVFGIIGIVLGILGLTVLRNNEKAFPIAGLIVSGIATVFGCLWIFVYIPNKNNNSSTDYLTASNTESSSSSSATVSNTDKETASISSKNDSSATSSSSNTSISSKTSSDSETETTWEDVEESWDEVEENWNDVKDAWNDIFSSDSDNNSDTNKEESDPFEGVKTVGIGEEFGNKTITGVVQDVDFDYKDYNDLWTTVPDGKKCIFIKIKVKNISNASNYVTVSDFACYVDDVSVNAELVNGMGDEDYNANIDPGRSAILGALYVIPKDAESIELEYNPIGEYAERVIIKIK